MNRFLLVAVPVVAATAFLLGQRDAPPPVRDVTPAPVLAPRDPMVSKLRAEVEALRADVAARPVAVAPEPESGPAAEPAEPVHPPDPDEQMAEHVARYASAMASDPVDTAWSAGAERALRGAFAAAGPTDATLDEVTCRASLCRLGLRFPSPRARELGAPMLPSRVPWDTAGIMQEDEDDPSRVILYAARSAELAPTP